MERIAILGMMLISALGFMGGYLFTVLGYAGKSGIEPLIMLNGSIGTAFMAALLNAGIVGGFSFVLKDRHGAVWVSTPLAESVAALGSFLFASLGLRMALWLIC